MANYFFPSSDDSLLSWATDYRDTIESHATELGMTPAEVTEEKGFCDAIIDSLKDVSTERGKLKSALDNRDAVIADKGDIRDLQPAPRERSSVQLSNSAKGSRVHNCRTLPSKKCG